MSYSYPMKKILFIPLLILIVVLVGACKKNPAFTLQDSLDQINRVWKMHGTRSGTSGYWDTALVWHSNSYSYPDTLVMLITKVDDSTVQLETTDRKGRKSTPENYRMTGVVADDAVYKPATGNPIPRLNFNYKKRTLYFYHSNGHGVHGVDEIEMWSE